MGKLLIVVAVMVGTVAAWVSALRGSLPLQSLFATAFFGLILLLGVIGLLAALSDTRRRASVRRTRINGQNVWVWTDLRGRDHWSDTDPRIKWDAENENSGGRWGY